ncbi:hypothetical protein L1987_33256 [Smallanthus sonchifolius]|uniref:Uncharacterized protein n=1 Tax=Smallanthus sonchifolius TaxID=185202 RepID=A0ACB9HS78_9ASTR|nr:hypothetical protein L1987_33256 [Smallanthus sonchifolius]
MRNRQEAVRRYSSIERPESEDEGGGGIDEMAVVIYGGDGSTAARGRPSGDWQTSVRPLSTSWYSYMGKLQFPHSKNEGVTALFWGALPQPWSDRQKDHVETNPERLTAASVHRIIIAQMILAMHTQESSQPATEQSIFVPTGDVAQHVHNQNQDYDYFFGKLSEPPKASIRAASLEDARHLARSCDRLCQEVETQFPYTVRHHTNAPLSLSTKSLNSNLKQKSKEEAPSHSTSTRALLLFPVSRYSTTTLPLRQSPPVSATIKIKTLAF